MRDRACLPPSVARRSDLTNDRTTERGAANTQDVRKVRWLFIVGYLIVLALSHALAGHRRAEPVRSVPVGDDGRLTLAYAEWTPAQVDTPVVVLLHGSPGDSSNFAALGPLLAERGYRVLAPDLLGFGKSSLRVPDHSMRAQGRAVGRMLEQVGVQRADIVGWSNGGGAALWLAHDEPEHVRSLTLMGSIGEQRFEGSGNYWLEHAKYRVGFVLLGVLPETLPHFGLLGTFDSRTGWLRNFMASDQREIATVMQRLRAGDLPGRTLVLHGAGDFLVREQSARSMHAALPGSTLVMMNAGHFLPFQQAQATAARLDSFFRGESRGQVIEEPVTRARSGLLWLTDTVRALVRAVPWWVHMIMLAGMTLRRPAWGLLLAATLVASVWGPGVDVFVAWLGLLLGMALWTWRVTLRGGMSRGAWTARVQRSPLTEGWNAGILHSWREEAAAGLWQPGLAANAGGRAWLARAVYVLGVVVWSVVALVVAIVGAAVIEHGFAASVHGWSAVVASLVLLAGWFKIGWSAPRLPSVLSPRGWRFARIAFERAVLFEYWPTWLVYLPIFPGLLWLAAKNRKLLAFTAVNPAISHAGGFVGERKSEIIEDLTKHDGNASGLVARTVRVEPSADVQVRCQMARERMQHASITLPAIAKPDEGQRGFAVKLLRSEDDIAAYCQTVRGAFLVQQFAKGPHECGILWCRRAGVRQGFIFSITAKEFPVIEGDGRHTLEELLERHPRYRRQHRVFLTRFADMAMDVPAKGERLALGVAGNHCQGTKFVDGAHLITPALASVIEDLCTRYAGSRFASDPLGGLDWVRFDVRFESEEKLRTGEAFTIVEMNGSSAESTNIYDPTKSLWWSYCVLWSQWRTLFALGRERMDAGQAALTAAELLRMYRSHAQGRTGNSVAD